MRFTLSDIGIAVISGAFVCTRPTIVSSASPQEESVLRAKAFNVLSVTVPGTRTVSEFDLEFSFDGENYFDANVGLPRAWRLFYSIRYEEGATSIRVPIVAYFEGGNERLLLREPERYWFRWRIEHTDGSEPTEITQDFRVLEATAADLEFLERLADPGVCRLLVRPDWFDEFTETERLHYADPEPRAVRVIGRLLSMTRAKSATSALATYAPKGDLQAGAAKLLIIAKDLPESSYAPYAAYYAGLCYLGSAFTDARETVRVAAKQAEPLTRADESRIRTSTMNNDERSAKATTAFTLSAERADEYLRPKVLYQRAFCELFSGRVAQAEKSLAQLEAIASSDPQLKDRVTGLREELDVIKSDTSGNTDR